MLDEKVKWNGYAPCSRGPSARTETNTHGPDTWSSVELQRVSSVSSVVTSWSNFHPSSYFVCEAANLIIWQGIKPNGATHWMRHLKHDVVHPRGSKDFLIQSPLRKQSGWRVLKNSYRCPLNFGPWDLQDQMTEEYWSQLLVIQPCWTLSDPRTI